jgi:hypothetical protein
MNTGMRFYGENGSTGRPVRQQYLVDSIGFWLYTCVSQEELIVN